MKQGDRLTSYRNPIDKTAVMFYFISRSYFVVVCDEYSAVPCQKAVSAYFIDTAF